MRSRGLSWVLTRSVGDGASGRGGKSGASEDPRTVWQRVNGFDLAGFGGQPEGFRRHVQNPCGVAEVEPRLDPIFGRRVDRNAVMRAQRRDALASPAIAIA